MEHAYFFVSTLLQLLIFVMLGYVYEELKKKNN